MGRGDIRFLRDLPRRAGVCFGFGYDILMSSEKQKAKLREGVGDSGGGFGPC